MSKRTHDIHAKGTEEQKAAIAERARAAGMTTSAYVLKAALAGATPAPQSRTAAPTAALPASLEVHHVDELGSDPWYRNNGALAR